MNKNTILYGILIAGGAFAYYSYKKNSEKAKKTLTTSTSETFVDDVSVLQPTPTTNPAIGLAEDVKKSVSKIIEPIIG